MYWLERSVHKQEILGLIPRLEGDICVSLPSHAGKFLLFYVVMENKRVCVCVCVCYSLSGRPRAGHVLTHPYPPGASSEFI